MLSETSSKRQRVSPVAGWGSRAVTPPSSSHPDHHEPWPELPVVVEAYFATKAKRPRARLGGSYRLCTTPFQRTRSACIRATGKSHALQNRMRRAAFDYRNQSPTVVTHTDFEFANRLTGWPLDCLTSRRGNQETCSSECLFIGPQECQCLRRAANPVPFLEGPECAPSQHR